MKTVLIFGGAGFVGKHIVRRLAKNGYKIIIPYQTQVNEAKLRLLGTTGQIIAFKFKHLNEVRMINLLNSVDIVINLKTTWNEKKFSFKETILDFNVNLVKKIKKNTLFIYFSGIGVDEKNNSNRSNAIYKSEKYIIKNLKNSVIIRPGIILGGGDLFLKGLVPLFRMSFFIPLFGNGQSKFQPVFIDDVSMAINKIIESSIPENKIYEFLGPEIFTYKEFYGFLAKCMQKTKVLVPIPLKLVKIVVSIMEKTPISPLNLEQLKLFEKNNIGSNNYKNLKDLGVFHQDLREIIKKIIKKNI